MTARLKPPLATRLAERAGRVLEFLWSGWAGLAALFLLAAVWQAGHEAYGPFILTSPQQTVAAVWQLAGDSSAWAVAATLSIVCIGPPLLMLVANVMQNQGPDGFGDIVLTLVRVLVAGTMLTLMFTSVTMGVASLTDRKSIATAGIILLMLVSVMVAGMFSAATKSDLPLVASILTLSLDLGPRVHNEAMLDSLQLSNLTVYLAWLAWTVAGFTIARLRIHSLPVTR